jgi:hypothetical protein
MVVGAIAQDVMSIMPNYSLLIMSMVEQGIDKIAGQRAIFIVTS